MLCYFLRSGECYTSQVRLFRPYLVTAVSEDLTLFEHLKSAWEFRPQQDHTCHVDFAVSFKFKSARHAFLAK